MAKTAGFSPCGFRRGIAWDEGNGTLYRRGGLVCLVYGSSGGSAGYFTMELQSAVSPV